MPNKDASPPTPVPVNRKAREQGRRKALLQPHVGPWGGGGRDWYLKVPLDRALRVNKSELKRAEYLKNIQAKKEKTA